MRAAYFSAQSHQDRFKYRSSTAAYLVGEELELRIEQFSKWQTAQMVNANEEFQLALNVV